MRFTRYPFVMYINEYFFDHLFASSFVRRLKRISHSCTSKSLQIQTYLNTQNKTFHTVGFFVNQYLKKRGRALIRANDDKYGVDDD